MVVRRLFHAALLLLALSSPLRAADPRPVVGPGATKDDVINAYGWPNGQSRSGTKEILTYPQGQVTLENGRVEKVDFAPGVPWPTPRPRPPPASPTPKKQVVEEPVDFWLADFDEAAREAARRNARILALFTGSDWSPASKQFHEQVESHPDFINAFTGDFVFLKLDFPTRAPVVPEQLDKNNRLRERLGVTAYPTLLVLSQEGNVVAQVDLVNPPAGDSYRDRVIAAVRRTRDALVAAGTPTPPAAAAESETKSPDEVPAPLPPPPPGVVSSLGKASAIVFGGIAAGLLLAAVGWWFIWRERRAVQKGDHRAATGLAERISDAASGLPSVAEMAGWPKGKLRAVVAGLAEADGYGVTTRPVGGEADIELTRPRAAKPSVLVVCIAGDAGIVSARRVRELLGTMTAEGMDEGRVVSTVGFAKDAVEFARQHKILLIDNTRLLEELRALPPLLQSKVLLRPPL